MSIDANPSGNSRPAPGIKHWLFQLLPPVLMLCVFFTTTNGTALVFVAGFLLLPVLVSLISIIAKLIFFSKRKYYLARPVLTVAMFILILAIANWTYRAALDQAIDEAVAIHRLCNDNSVCPENPTGWQRDGSSISKHDLGFWLKYTASYHYAGESFRIRLYRGPDIGDNISAGVNRPVKVARYEEG